MRDFSVLQELPSDGESGFTNELLSCIKVGFTEEIARGALSATERIGSNKVGLQLVGNVFGIDLGNMGGIVTARLCGKRFLVRFLLLCDLMMGASSSDDLAFLGQPHIWGLHSARQEVRTYLAREQGRCESQELR